MNAAILLCDHSSFAGAVAIRAALESFGLRTYLHHCAQEKHVREALAGELPPGERLILCAGALPGEGDPGPAGLTFRFARYGEGKFRAHECRLTAEEIGQAPVFRGRRLLALGAGAGRDEFAAAFLQAGALSLIAPVGRVDPHSATLFAVAFFYHLQVSRRDPALSLTESRAAEQAASLDLDFRFGTRLFRYYCR